MAEGDEMNSLPVRVRKMEQSMHTLNHRMEAIDKERLPYRLSFVEQSMLQVQDEVKEIKQLTRDVGSKLDKGIDDLSTKQNDNYQQLKAEADKNRSFIRGIFWAGGAIMVVVQLLPILKELVRHWAS